MKARKFQFILLLSLFFFQNGFCQKILRISLTRGGMLKTHDLQIGDEIRYKIVGSSQLFKNKIANLQDSLIIFTNDSLVFIGDLRFIRFRKKNIAVAPFQNLLLKCAVLFPLITSVNNMLRQNEPYLRDGAIIVTASCLGVYAILERLQIKRIKINKRHSVQILDYNYKNLNQK